MKWIVRIGILSLVVRFAYLLQNMGSSLFGRPLLDQHYYDLCARQLAGMGGDLLDGFRPLLYPAFLSLIYRLDAGGGVFWAIIAQHVLGVLMALLIAMGAARLFKQPSAGIVAGLLFCLAGPPLFFEGKLLITTLFSCLLLLFLLAVLRAIDEERTKRSAWLWLLAGLLLGLSAQARPNALPLALFFPVLAGYRLLSALQPNPLGGRRSDGAISPDSARTEPRSPFLFLLPLVAIPGLLVIQLLFGAWNAAYSGSFSLTTQAGGINFYLGNSQKADGMIPRQDRHVVYEGAYRDPIQEMSEQGFREATGKTGDASPAEVSDFWKRKTLAEIQSDPARWLGLMAKKSWLMLWNHEVPNNFSYGFAAMQDTPILRWLPVRWWLLLSLFPWGIAALLKRKQVEAVLWVVSFLALFSATIMLFFVNSRFRIPLWPCMALLAGGGAMELYVSIKARRVPILPSVASLLLLALSLINWFGIPPDPIENDLSLRATAFYEHGQYAEALRDIDECLDSAPGNPRYHFVKGNILLASDLNKEAIASFLKAISLNAGDPTFHNNLGIAFENIGELEKARISYGKALELRPNGRTTLTNLALFSIRNGEFDQAEAMLGQLLQEYPHDTTLLCARSILDFKYSADESMRDRAMQMNKPLAVQLLQ